MPRRPRPTEGLHVWRVQGLRDLELVRAERPVLTAERELHGQFEITVVERGAQRVRHRGATITAGAASLVVIAPGEVHSHATGSRGLSYCSFFPDEASLTDASKEAGLRTAHAPSFGHTSFDDAWLAAKIGRLHRMLERPGSVLARETLAVTVATELVRRHSGERLRELRIAPEGHAIERVKAYLQSRLDGFVRLGALCALTGLRPYTLVRAFTNRVGMPPGAYHLQLRVNRAKQLLRQGEPLSFVAAATGFTDQSHLTRHFRRITGVTPGAYAATFLP